MQPFNLDRFKAGEPAIDKDDNSEQFYLADLPDGKIAVSFFHLNEWETFSCSVQHLKNESYMKEKELTYVELCNMWANDKSNSKGFFDWLQENFELTKRKNK